MAEENVITEDNFEALLDWLDRNRETAAEKYEKIRGRLIRIFVGRGCFEAEELADETFDRVTRKLPHLAEGYLGDPVLYFYGVADKIHLEWLRKQNKTKQLHFPKTGESNQIELEIEYECLEICLEKISGFDRALIVDYYERDKSARIENRRKLAKNLEISPNTLQVKASRIRVRLKQCLRNCINEKK